jgi:hypothetical protein
MYCLGHIWSGEILLQLKLNRKLDISSFRTIYGRFSNSSIRERTTCLKLGLKSAKNVRKLEIQAT